MKYLFVLMLVLLGFNQTAVAGNPGRPAGSCVVDSHDGEKVTFENQCGQDVFVIYCGDLKYSNQKCGDGPGGGYYTHSFNLGAGDSRDTEVTGDYRFGSCEGSIGFGSDEYDDSPGGQYSCVAEGGDDSSDDSSDSDDESAEAESEDEADSDDESEDGSE